MPATATYSAEQLTERTIYRHAIDAVVWGMPLVNYDLLYQAMRKAGGQFNQVVYWSRLPDWKNQTLTPNADTLYFIPFVNTKDVGPVVLELPPANGGRIVGTVDDAWQTAIEDVGPAGLDKGEGGRYLILPPAFSGNVPAGVFPMLSSTYQSYACCGRIPRAPATETSQRPSRTASASRSTRSPRPRARPRRCSSTRSTSSTTARFRTTCGSSSHSIAWSSTSRGSSATRR
jgi:hypothetical protein